ncbi:MAG: hypothetical protein WEB51_05750 [Mycobacterium sp.]
MIPHSATAVVDALLYPVFGVLQRGAAALGAAVNLLTSTVRSIVDNTALVLKVAQTTAERFVGALSDGDFEAAYNVAVSGLLGISLPDAAGEPCYTGGECNQSVPGQIIRSTIGLFANYPNRYDLGFVNSIRATVTGGIQGIAEALSAPVNMGMSTAEVSAGAAVPTSSATVAVPDTSTDAADLTPERANLRTTAVVGLRSAESGDPTPESGESATAGDAPTPKTARHRMSRTGVSTN